MIIPLESDLADNVSIDFKNFDTSSQNLLIKLLTKFNRLNLKNYINYTNAISISFIMSISFLQLNQLLKLLRRVNLSVEHFNLFSNRKIR